MEFLDIFLLEPVHARSEAMDFFQGFWGTLTMPSSEGFHNFHGAHLDFQGCHKGRFLGLVGWNVSGPGKIVHTPIFTWKFYERDERRTRYQLTI